MCGVCSKLTIKIPERRTYFTPCPSVSVVDFEQVNAGWELTLPRLIVRVCEISLNPQKGWVVFRPNSYKNGT